MLIQQILNGLSVGMTYSLTAIGFTLIFGVLGLVNFAHGEVYMIGAFVTFTLSQFLGWGLVPSFIGGVIAGAIVGMAMEKIAFKPLRRMKPETTMLATLGLSILLKEIAVLIWGPETQSISTSSAIFAADWGGDSIRISGIQVVIFIVSIALMAGLQLLLYKTRIGFGIRSIAQNRDAAYLMGVNVNRTINYTFAIGAAMGAAAGVLVAFYYGALDPYMGFMPGIKAFVAMVLGGLTSIPGAVVGGLILGMSETMAGAYIHSGLQDAIAFLLLVLLLILRPTGLGGRKRGV
ncbi:branched-chain amino acid ABC transporter permease [Brevibacillus sp. B_LB10_24]|uniref:branched-chain amino acid ABC transporter permease n=1 Tax=Brevibacillus sp. B_LB10_24 TaxID=3380645 RepID=UPI0038B8CC53